MSTTKQADEPRTRPWSLERALFALAGTVTLASVILGVVVSPWFLLLAVMTGVSQLAFVATGACPASFVLRRFTSLRGCTR